MQKSCISYIPYQSLLLSTIVLYDRRNAVANLVTVNKGMSYQQVYLVYRMNI